MPEQERKQKRADGGPPADGGQGSGTVAAKGKKLKEDMDKLVDEIDDVLESYEMRVYDLVAQVS